MDAVLEAFQTYGNGLIPEDELAELLLAGGMSYGDVRALMSAVDIKDGMIQSEELLTWLFEEPETGPGKPRLAGKVAIVTGAGSAGPGWGVGKAIAVAMSREGAAVGLVDVNTVAAEETASIINGEGGKCAVLPKCDISKVDQVEEMVAACEKALGKITTLVNNVGLVCPGDVVSVPLGKWDFINNINLMGAYNCTKACVQRFLNNRKACSIVNVSSISSLRALRSEVAYAASKGGMNALTFSVARELAGKNIRCNNIAPGIIETPLVWNAYKDRGPEELKKIMAERHAQSPTGKMGDAWDIAYACIYFASDECKYVNGVTMAADGSFTQQVLPHAAGAPLLTPSVSPPPVVASRKLNDKVAIVTGTAFCSDIAKKFIQEGAKVFVVGEDANSIAASVGANCTGYRCDIASVDAVEEMVKACVSANGGVDILVSGPGIDCSKSIVDTSNQEFVDVYRRNASSLLYLLRFAIPSMLERGGGAIVTMPSMAGFRYLKPEVAVAAAAGSVMTITVQTAAEFAPKGIRCNALVPFTLVKPAADAGYKADVANVATYLCSEESRYISGQAIHMDMSQAHRVTVNF